MEQASAVLRPGANREDAVLLAIETDRTELPVVEADGQFQGAVTAQAIIDTMHQEHLADVLRRGGVRHTGERISDIASERVRDAVRSRIPWLLFGLVAGLFLSVISSQFEGTMRETIALAFFPPVIAYIADSVGTQSEAIAIRAFALREVEYGAYLRRELGVGVVVGGVLGILGGVGAFVVGGSVSIGVVVGLSLFVSSAVATALASLIPIGFIAVGIDPALGSGPLATALQDGLSLVIYFLFAVVLL
jgi:magnesium transporter